MMCSKLREYYLSLKSPLTFVDQAVDMHSISQPTSTLYLISLTKTFEDIGNVDKLWDWKRRLYTGKHSSMCWGWAIRYPSVFCRSLNLIFSGFSSLIYLKIVALFPFSFQWWILYFDVVCCLYFDGICVSGLTVFSTQISI